MKNSDIMTPFKWAGSKRMELAKLRLLTGIDVRVSVVEPFMGTGIFSGMFGRKDECYGNDLNKDIISLYEHCENPIFYGLAKELLTKENHEHDKFYEIREKYNSFNFEESSAEKSAYFYYLQNTAHFGLYRINKENKYTSTYHYLERPYKFEQRYASLLFVKKRFKQINNLDYRVFINSLEHRNIHPDLFFFDPPYIQSSYDDYSVGQDFTIDDLNYIADYAKFLFTNKGICSIICNYSTVNDEQIYKGCSEIVKINTVRQMNLQNVKDKNFKESIYVLYGSLKSENTINFL